METMWVINFADEIFCASSFEKAVDFVEVEAKRLGVKLIMTFDAQEQYHNWNGREYQYIYKDSEPIYVTIYEYEYIG